MDSNETMPALDAATIALMGERDQYRKGLEDAKRHLETIMPKSDLKMSAIYQIVCSALGVTINPYDRDEKTDHAQWTHERKPGDPEAHF